MTQEVPILFEDIFKEVCPLE
ncbi:hypothetical protein CAEBREN_31492 [Caenorhabditis brenneri]|uniref:Uncharacterized protein n=1 Tax=Caenorhabditis brenneri TaxID=135651 RepID=G0M8B6_CAEBE|nr:hypothetical protein CAEBREN_31492 [Caenorhabditis brenneri]